MIRLISVVLVSVVSLSFGEYKKSRLYDYQTGSNLSTTTTGNNSRTYDYSTGNSYSSRKSSTGTISTYDYGSGTYSTTRKTGSGTTTYDYETGSYSNTRKSGNNYYNNSGNSNTRKRAVTGSLLLDE
jgi:hypothetical protein